MTDREEGRRPAVDTSKLAPYLEARAAIAARASERPEAFAGSALDACHALSDSLDASLGAIFEAQRPSGVALVAVGGYGRREQSRHSDIDLMVLVEGRSTTSATQLLYPLWDADLKLGHSIRTVPEATEAARQNVETLTALLDARLVAGDEALYGRFEGARASMLRRATDGMVAELRARRADLVAREPWQLQEPDLKNGRGGLRALHVVRWIDAAEALASGNDPPTIAHELEPHLETLLATRNALHALGTRPNDRYLRDLAPQTIEWLGVERDEWERALFEAMRVLDAASAARLDRPARARRFTLRWPRRGSRTDEDTASDPEGDLERLLAELRGPGAERLEPLPRSAWLERVLPEWEVVRALPHATAFHRHPVDVHIRRTVDEALFALRADPDDTGTLLAAEHVADESEVILAALLHDIGKGHEGDHSEVGAVVAERFAARVGIEAEAAHRLSEVARLHLLLPNVATRRDIADARVIAETAAQVGEARLLHLLHIVSVADARATGPDVWSPWKAQLMRSLYLRTLAVLSEEGAEEATSQRLRAAVLEALGGRWPAAAIAAHLDGLPASYLLSTPPETIGRHIEQIEAASGGTLVRHEPLGAMERVTVVTPDRPGILSLVAGTLAVHNVNVLGGSAFTRDDGVAIEVLHVGDALGHGIDERRWARIEDAVPRALAGDFDVEARLKETRATYHAVPRVQMETSVTVDNVGSDRYSIVEVNTADRLGLLFAITKALHGLSLDIHLAKVDTIGAEVVDAFYVLRENGRRIEDEDEIERIERRVCASIEALDAS
ncbi:MAG: HD domain-containing protein [Dehalococcoidia bacterium]